MRGQSPGRPSKKYVSRPCLEHGSKKIETSEIPDKSKGIDQYTKELDAHLRLFLSDRNGSLYSMVRYQLGWQNQEGEEIQQPHLYRPLPLLCLLTCEGLGGDPKEAMSFAAAVELANNFYQVHDDIKNGSPNRGSRPSIWWLWGPAQAINAGDALHALSRLSIFFPKEKGRSDSLATQALHCLDKACLQACEGDFSDLTFVERVDISVEQYLNMIQDKSGALLGAGAKLGALAATDDGKVLNMVETAGKRLGQSMQISQDIASIWGKGSDRLPGETILNKRKTLPVAYSMEKASLKEKREIGTIYYKRVLEVKDIEQLIVILDKMQAREYSSRVSSELKIEAMDLLKTAGVSKTGVQAIQALIEDGFSDNH